MQNIKIAVNSTDESLEIQQLLIELGYVWESCGTEIQKGINIPKYDFCTEHGFIRLTRKLKAETGAKLITLNDLREMVRIKMAENEIIFGAEAMNLALQGHPVQYREVSGSGNRWRDFSKVSWSIEELTSSNFQFRRKPSKILLNLELPVPFKPDVGDPVFFLSPTSSSGWDYFIFNGDDESEKLKIRFGAWRTKDQIEIVVDRMKILGVMS